MRRSLVAVILGDVLLFTGFGLTNEYSGRISLLLNKFKIINQCFDMPAIYETYWGIHFLSKSFQAEIKSSTDIMSDTGHTLWFALVLSFNNYIDFAVYLTPDFKSARLRKGSILNPDEILRKKRMESNIEWLKNLSIYYQVSLPDKPFTNEILPPDYYTMPFSVDYTSYNAISTIDGKKSTALYTPEPITDEELIDIIDGARKYLELKDGPIYKISKMKDVVTIKTAICRFSMSGRGTALTLMKNNGKWELLSKSHWLS